MKRKITANMGVTENHSEISSPETGPFFVGGPKGDLHAHITPHGVVCKINKGSVLAVRQVAFYNQEARVACECGVVTTEST